MWVSSPLSKRRMTSSKGFAMAHTSRKLTGARGQIRHALPGWSLQNRTEDNLDTTI